MSRKLALLVSTALVASLSGVPAVAENDSVSEFQAATEESAQQNQQYAASNVETAANATCAISPWDVQSDRWRSAGAGTPQAVVENVTVKAVDYAVFEAVCTGVQTQDFTLKLDYSFEVRLVTGEWVEASPPFHCATQAESVGTTRTAIIVVPGNLDCEHRHIYDENDPSLGKSHRLFVHLTTTLGHDIKGVSKPWPMFCVTGSDCALEVDITP